MTQIIHIIFQSSGTVWAAGTSLPMFGVLVLLGRRLHNTAQVSHGDGGRKKRKTEEDGS